MADAAGAGPNGRPGRRVPHAGRSGGAAWSGSKAQPRKRGGRISGEDVEELTMREEQRRRSGEECTRGGGDHRRGRREYLRRRDGRDVAADADQVIDLIPKVQKEFFHRGPLYGSIGYADVRALTLAPNYVAACSRIGPCVGLAATRVTRTG